MKVLGLDFGTNSLGWCLVEKDENENITKIIDLGSYIYQDGRDATSHESLNQTRRQARGTRKNHNRKKERLRQLFNKLVEFNLYPKDKHKQSENKKMNVFELRDKAVKEELKDFELGRVIYHIAKHRGFKSNRKQTGEMKTLQSTVDNTKQLLGFKEEENGNKITYSKTIGQLLYERYNKRKEEKKEVVAPIIIPTRIKQGVDLYFLRRQYEYEFEKIKEIQQQYHKLTQEQWDQLSNIIFKQRDLKPQQSGKCEFMKDETRINKIYPSFQKFRLLCDLNNLAYFKKGERKNERRIVEMDKKKPSLFSSTENKDKAILNKIYEKCLRQKTISFSKIKQLLNLDSNEYQFNYEATDWGNKNYFYGIPTSVELSKDNLFGEKWYSFNDEQQDEIVDKLLNENEEEILRVYLRNLGIAEENIKNIIAFDLESIQISNKEIKGYGKICQKLTLAMLPYLKEGLTYNTALEKLGYKDSGNYDGVTNEEGLPNYSEVLTNYLDINGKIANPTVHIGLNRLRIVVNEIIKKYGKPDIINIEVGKELGYGAKKYNEEKSKHNKNHKDNEDIVKALKQLGIKDSRDNITKYKLWRELDINGNKVCPYCGKIISIGELYSPNIHIEHILPRATTGDDSFNNKTLACANCNAEKGNRSPEEHFDSERLKEIIERIEKITKENKQSTLKSKLWRFKNGALEYYLSKGEFSERAMNDTKYLSKVAREYLLTLFGRTKENEKYINTIRGGLTAKIRNKYKLNDILYSTDLSNLTEDEKREKLLMLSAKNRNNHRHHSIDAFVIAMCNKKMIQALSHEYDKIEDKEKLFLGFNNIKDLLKKQVNDIYVHIRPTHSSQGRLNEEDNYGNKMTIEEKNNGYNYYIRKPLIDLSINRIANIRDKTIRKSLYNEICLQFNLPQKKGEQEQQEQLKKVKLTKEQEKDLKEMLKNYGEKNNIRNIRILEKENGLIPITTVNALGKQDVRYIKTGENHHLEYWKLPKNIDIQKVKEKLKEFEEEGILTWIDKNNKCCCLTYNYLTLNKILSKDKNYKKLTSKTKEQKEIDKKDIKTKNYKSVFNSYKPHPSAKLIMKLHNRDIVKCINKNGNTTLMKVDSIIPSSNRIRLIEYLYLRETNEIVKEIKDEETKKILLKDKVIEKEHIAFSKFKEKQLRSVYISPIGKIYDNNKWFSDDKND